MCTAAGLSDKWRLLPLIFSKIFENCNWAKLEGKGQEAIAKSKLDAAF